MTPFAAKIAVVEITARRLTQADYARYGDVISADRDDVVAVPANLGTAQKRNRLTDLVNARPDAKANVSVFRCAPVAARPIPLALLEKHPQSTQIFVPMNARRYLVVVAEGGDAPDLATLSAFVAVGTQAIAYRPGIWHHPMIALDEVIDFTCIVFDDGTAHDCVEAHGLTLPSVRLDPGAGDRRVVLGDVPVGTDRKR